MLISFSYIWYKQGKLDHTLFLISEITNGLILLIFKFKNERIKRLVNCWKYLKKSYIKKQLNSSEMIILDEFSAN